MKKVICCICVLGIIVAITYLCTINGKDRKIVNIQSHSNENEIKREIAVEKEDCSCHDYFVKKMTEMNFNPELIEKIFDCNEMVFTSWYEYNPKELNRQIGAFSSLKGKSDIQQCLLKNPDVATLVAAVASIDVEYAKTVLDTLPGDVEDGKVIRSLYAFYATPNDAIKLSRMLCYDSNQKYIIELFKQGCGDIAFLRFFEILEENRETAPHAAKVYKEWLYSLLDEMLAMDPESDEADNNYLLLVSQSEPLMETLKSNEEFCNNFFVKYWNDYSEILKSIPSDDEFKEAKFLSYISNDDLWKFLIAYPETGTQLVKIYGDFAPDFLMKTAFLDNPLAKERIVNLMLSANIEQGQAFIQIPEDALLLYARFLQRNLDNTVLMNGTIVMVNAEHLGSGSSAKQKLEYWEGLSDEVLLRDDDFAPDNVTLVSWLPGYDIGVILFKYVDGRKVNTSDIVMAGIDTAFIAWDIIGIVTAPATGGGSMVTVEAAKSAAKSAAKTSVLKGTVKMGVKATAKVAAKQTSKSVFKRIGLAGVKASRQVVRKEWISMIKDYAKKMTRINITSKVQALFKNSPLKNATFKRLTGLDARIFMRSDRRIIFNFDVAIKRIVNSNLLKSLTDDVFFGAAGYLVMSTPEAQDAVVRIKEVVEKKIKNKSEEELWKSDLSAWWMMNQYSDFVADDNHSNEKVMDQSSNETDEMLEQTK